MPRPDYIFVCGLYGFFGFDAGHRYFMCMCHAHGIMTTISKSYVATMLVYSKTRGYMA